MKKIITTIVLIVLGFALYYAVFDTQNPTEQTVSNEEVTSEEAIDTDSDLESSEIPLKREPSRFACVGEYCDGSMSGENAETYSVVNIPLIQEEGTLGCGVGIFFAPHVVPKTQALLDATYSLLFDIKATPEIPDDNFRNTVAVYDQLFYKNVVLDQDGTARVYLMGNMYGPGHCSLPEIRHQVTAAALQFDSVLRVEVYLNQELYNWCEQDASDGEGSCPENPDYWVNSK